MTVPRGGEDDLRTPRLRRIERGVEEQLARLAESGELSGLPGEGKPLPRDTDAAGDRWAAFRVMSQQKILPGWAQLRLEIDAEHAAITRRARAHLEWAEHRRRQLRDLRAERILEETRRSRERDTLVRAELSGRVDELNRRVARYNAVVPIASLQLVPFSAERIFDLTASAIRG